MQQQLSGGESAKGNHSFMLIVLVLCVMAYVAYRMKMIPKSVLSAVGLGGGSSSSSPPSPGGPVGSSSSSHATAKPVTGHVVFDGAEGNVGKAGCHWFLASDFPVENRLDGSKCKVQVDPCKLVGQSLDAAPECHTVETLCKSKTVPVVNLGTKSSPQDQCFLQEKAGGGTPVNNLAGVRVPEGISLDVNSGSACGKTSLFSKQCNATSGCAYAPTNFHLDAGFQFGVAPGYKLTCDGKTTYGPDKTKGASE